MSHVTKTFITLKALLLSLMFGASQVAADTAEERDAWNAAQMLGTREAYQAFLEAFPTSAHADQALSSMVSAISSPAGGGTGATADVDDPNADISEGEGY